MKEPVYIAIDLKSFYASVECRERGLDPMNTNLVVADPSRTEKTICLAVSPPLKARGVPGRPRLFEVVQRVAVINRERERRAPGRVFSGSSVMDGELETDPGLKLDYLTAPPRMALYMEYSTRIYRIYMKYVAPEDIHVYSIDEVFIDATPYLRTAGCTPREFAMNLIRDVLTHTGITATAGIGTNLYLAKIAMDIVAKHITPDENGVRIAQLSEQSYREQLWDHRPITDFWRVGPGYARKLEQHGMYTMGDVARCSVGKPEMAHSEALLYRLFGVNAELLIDHAWGYESVSLADIKAYRPATSSIGHGQVLMEPYPWDKARLIVREMADGLSLELLDRNLTTSQVVLDVGYDVGNGKQGRDCPVGTTVDRYGRAMPKPAHGSYRLPAQTSSAKQITDAALDVFDRITDRRLTVRRLSITCAGVSGEEAASPSEDAPEQIDMFTDYAALTQAREAERKGLAREKQRQRAVLDIRKKYGKNAILRGMNLLSGATARSRNGQIGGHKA